MIKIDKKVPLPDLQPRMKYPFSNMEPGDSFFVEVELDEPEDYDGDDFSETEEGIEQFKDKSKKLKGSISGAARRYRDTFQTGEEPKFLTRVVELGVRCWRVS
jgi:hypothetical protein